MADDRRTRILDAAEELFAEDGFDATPTARIADAAAVPKGLVFYYFPRKIDLLLTLLQERLPALPPCDLHDVVRRGDPARSLLRLDKRLGLGQQSLARFAEPETTRRPVHQLLVQGLFESSQSPAHR